MDHADVHDITQLTKGPRGWWQDKKVHFCENCAAFSSNGAPHSKSPLAHFHRTCASAVGPHTGVLSAPLYVFQACKHMNYWRLFVWDTERKNICQIYFISTCLFQKSVAIYQYSDPFPRRSRSARALVRFSRGGRTGRGIPSEPQSELDYWDERKIKRNGEVKIFTEAADLPFAKLLKKGVGLKWRRTKHNWKGQ